MIYVYFAFDLLARFDEVVIMARGAAISRAVDVAEIITKRVGKGLLEVKSIRIGTEVVGEGARGEEAHPLMESISIKHGQGRPRKRPKTLYADTKCNLPLNRFYLDGQTAHFQLRPAVW